MNEIIKVNYAGEDLQLEFRKPSRLVYANVFNKITKQDYYEAIEILVKNCYVKAENGIELIDEEPLKIEITFELIERFFKFKTVDIDTEYKGDKYKKEYNKLKENYSTIFTVTIGSEEDEKKVFFIKNLTKEDYKAIFNSTIQNPLMALNYIWDKLKIGGDNDINQSDDYYLACLNIGEYLLSYKNIEIKKK